MVKYKDIQYKFTFCLSNTKIHDNEINLTNYMTEVVIFNQRRNLKKKLISRDEKRDNNLTKLAKFDVRRLSLIIEIRD